MHLIDSLITLLHIVCKSGTWSVCFKHIAYWGFLTQKFSYRPKSLHILKKKMKASLTWECGMQHLLLLKKLEPSADFNWSFWSTLFIQCVIPYCSYSPGFIQSTIVMLWAWENRLQKRTKKKLHWLARGGSSTSDREGSKYISIKILKY